MPQAQEDDAILVAQAQRGDASAFGRLVERYQDALFNGIYRMVSRREDAEDLAQEAFVKAFRGIASFEGRSSIYTWLYSIAVNLVISFRRKTGSSRRLNPLPLHDGGDDPGWRLDLAADCEQPSDAAERGELHQRIDHAIQSLDDDYRIMVVMRDIEGFDYETIAEALGCPQGTVKSRLHRARVVLREQLKDLLE